MINQEKEVEILRKVESGELSAEEGLQQLKAIDTASKAESVSQPAAAAMTPAPTVTAAVSPTEMPIVAPLPPALPESPVPLPSPVVPLPPIPPAAPEPPQAPAAPQAADRLTGEVEPGERELARNLVRWKRWWMVPFWVGVAITVAGAGLIYWGYTATHFGWGFWLAWPPFIFGLVVMILGWQSQRARWLHVRIRQKPGEKPGMIVISIPLPLRLAAWFLRHFGDHIPDVKGKGVDEVLLALEKSVSPDAPFYVNVDGEDGEHVEVFIG